MTVTVTSVKEEYGIIYITYSDVDKIWNWVVNVNYPGQPTAAASGSSTKGAPDAQTQAVMSYSSIVAAAIAATAKKVVPTPTSAPIVPTPAPAPTPPPDNSGVTPDNPVINPDNFTPDDTGQWDTSGSLNAGTPTEYADPFAGSYDVSGGFTDITYGFDWQNAPDTFSAAFNAAFSFLTGSGDEWYGGGDLGW